MRQIGTLTDARQAQRLADYLLTLGIRVQLEEQAGATLVWAFDEDRVAQARAEFQSFAANPEDARYVSAEREASRLRDALIRQENTRRRRLVDVRRQWERPRPKPLTFLLIVACCAVGAATGFSEDLDNRVARTLTIAEFRSEGNHVRWWGLGESWTDNAEASAPRFQFWRLLTPIFLHIGPWHLVFNMFALQVEASLIETRRGAWQLAWMVVLIGVLSNLAQYYVYKSPAFAGISGVVFGLFGYVWMKSEFDPGAGIVIHPYNVSMMLFFLVLCFTGIVGPIANGAHFAGLIVGILLGYGPIITRRILGR